MNILKILFLLPLLAWLTACGTAAIRERPQTENDWLQAQSSLNKIQHWAISGRISVQTEDDGGQADYTWKQNEMARYDIRLQAPLGAGTIWISGRPGRVSLKTSGGDELYDTDADKLLLRLNGWPLPVKGLRYWIRSLPSPDSEYQVTGWRENGSPAVMLQDGWRIEFKKYRWVAGQILPAKLFISRQGEGDKEVEVRLIIRQWNINPNEGKV